MRNILQAVKRYVFHGLKIYPIYRLLRRIDDHFPLKGCIALEAFAYTGELQAKAYSKYPAYMEAWEIAADCEERLKKNLPGAVIRVTNSFDEVLSCKRKFNFINVDTMQGIFGPYCENFEFFPLLFNVTADECVVNLNVIPAASAKWRKKYPTVFNAEHLERRKRFYQVSDPENISLRDMLKTYGDIAANNGYSIVWHEYMPRTLTYYLALHLKKNI